MKHLQTYESFKKTYGEKINQSKFKDIPVGKRLVYMGSFYTVVANDGYVLDLKGDDGDLLTVNLGQFNRAGQINEKEFTNLNKDETMKVAQLYAKAISKADGTKCTGNIKSIEPGSFDLDCDGIEYDGGSYYIDNGDVINAAISGKPVYGRWDDNIDTIVRRLKKTQK